MVVLLRATLKSKEWMKYKIENFLILRVSVKNIQSLTVVVTPSKGLQSLQQPFHLPRGYVHMIWYAQSL